MPLGSEFGCGFGWLARTWGATSGLLMILFGVFAIPGCLMWAVYMISVGFLVLMIEASCVATACGSEELSKQLTCLKHWQKAALYLLLAIPPILFCFGIRALFGAGAVFATGGVYFVLAIGGKGTSEDMIVKASRSDDTEMRVELMADTDDAPPMPSKQPLPEPSRPSPPLQKQPAPEPPKPTFTGSMPTNVPPAFPDSLLDSVGERTVPFTGTVPKPNVPRPTQVPSVAFPTSTASSMGPRTIAYTGPLKPVPAAIPMPPPSSRK